MKIILILVTTLLTISFYISTRSAAQSFDPLGKNAGAPVNYGPKGIRVYLESYEVTAIQYAEIMSTPSESTNHTALRNQLFQQCKEGKLKLVSNHCLVSRSSERAISESVLEFIYPTDVAPVEETLEKIQKLGIPANPPTPTLFETRNVGSTIEVEPSLGEDGVTVEVSLKTETVEHVGDIKHSQSPLFYTLRTDVAHLIMINGEFQLYSTSTPHLKGKPDNSRKILNFIRTEILSTR